MVRPEVALATNRDGWNTVAPHFHGSTALPEYGPLAPTEDSLRLLDSTSGQRVLELGCGSGHSLLYLAPVDRATVKEEHVDPSRWYSVARAQMMPTTFIIKARKPMCASRADLLV
jgi:hypothetical protein